MQMATVTSQAIRGSGTDGYSRPRPMTPALTPELAADYLRELSADILAVAVLTPAGERLAGPEELAVPARDLLAAAPGASELQVATGGGTVYAARSDHHALVVVCGRFALPALIRYDLKIVLGDLAPADPPARPASAEAA
jgi:hypothetical protein